MPHTSGSETTGAENRFSAGTTALTAAGGERIRSAYRAAVAADGETPSIWATFAAKSGDFQQALISGGDYAAYLDNPASNELCYGFDNLFSGFTELVKSSESDRAAIAAVFHRELVTLAEAVGAKRVWNPEAAVAKPEVGSVEDMLSAIDDQIGIRVDFPNPFPDEFGLVTSRGIASSRALHAIYQAWRLRNAARHFGGKILEIGAGLGRTAYYAAKMGLTSYTIVDLPATNVSQANYLLRTLGEDRVSLYGEPPADGKIRITVPSWLAASAESFDVMLNVDSMTEMPRPVALSYAETFARRGTVLVSINHEANHDTVHSLEPLRDRLLSRLPYAMRAGYLEETFINDNRLADVYASTSWRVTAPLRWLKRTISRPAQ